MTHDAGVWTTVWLHAGDLSAGGKSEPAYDALAASGPSADMPEQHAAPVRKRKAPAAPDGIAATKGAQEQNLYSAPAKESVKKKPRKAAVVDPLPHASAAKAQRQHHQQHPAGTATPTEGQKPSKKAREASAEHLIASREDISNAGSMPGIPGASAAEARWKQLDRRTDVKRGRFSEHEKETILGAVKVKSWHISKNVTDSRPGCAYHVHAPELGGKCKRRWRVAFPVLVSRGTHLYLQDFARAHGLSDTDMSWIYNTRNNLGNSLTAEDRTQRKGAWLVIAQALPHRTPKSVWAFATRILHEGNHMVRPTFPFHEKSFMHAFAQLIHTEFACNRSLLYTDMHGSGLTNHTESQLWAAWAGQMVCRGHREIAASAC